MSIGEISGVEYDQEPKEATNNDNVEPIHDSTDTISETTPEPPANDLRNDIMSNISVPQTRCTKVTNVEGRPYTGIQPGVYEISDPVESHDVNAGRSTRTTTIMNISSNKRCIYDIALEQALCINQIEEDIKGKKLSMNKGLKL